jgi:DNA-binding transcriptional regulator YdaS (Cro superfamily)
MDGTPPESIALQEAVNRLGSQSAMGRLLSVSQATVWKWLKRGKPLPAEHVLLVESATGISKHDLRPDIFPRQPAAVPEAAR